MRRMREVAPDAIMVVGGPLVFYSHKVLQEAPHLMSHPECKNVYFFSEGDPDPAIDATIIDGFVNLVGWVPRLLGAFVGFFHTGSINTYAFFITVGVLCALGLMAF